MFGFVGEFLLELGRGLADMWHVRTRRHVRMTPPMDATEAWWRDGDAVRDDWQRVGDDMRRVLGIRRR